MDNDFIRINIAFTPSKEAVDLAMRLSSEISQKADAFYVLDEKNFYSHVTIYFLEIPAKNLDRMLLAIEELSKEMSSIKFKFTKIGGTLGWIGIEAELSQEIKNIHEKIVEFVNPLREDHLREKYLAKLDTFPEKEKNNLRLYGHPHVLDLYRPHLTIIRLKNEKDAEKIAEEIDWPLKEFMLDKIGIFKMGGHGTCRELIKEFNLNSCKNVNKC